MERTLSKNECTTAISVGQYKNSLTEGSAFIDVDFSSFLCQIWIFVSEINHYYYCVNIVCQHLNVY